MARDDGMPSYVTQVASLGTAASAQELAAKLQGEGYSAFVEPAEVGGRTYYRVRVGPEVDRARADQTAAELGRKYKGPFVQRYP
jgi:DedD protein